MLVKTHGPERVDLAILVGIQVSQLDNLLCRHAGKLGNILRGIGLEECSVFFEGDQFRLVSELELVLQSIADILFATLENHAFFDKGFVIQHIADNDVGQAVHDCQIGLRVEFDILIRHLGGAGTAGAKIDDFDIGIFQPVVDHA